MKKIIIALMLLLLVGVAYADVLPMPGEYHEVIYTQQVVFEGNFDNYTFVWIGGIPSMCNPIIVEPSAEPQYFPSMYKLCNPKLYAFRENEFEQLLQDYNFVVEVNDRISTNKLDNFLIDAINDSGIEHAVSEFSGIQSQGYPRTPEYKILSEKHILLTETITSLDLASRSITNTETEEVTKFVDYTTDDT